MGKFRDGAGDAEILASLHPTNIYAVSRILPFLLLLVVSIALAHYFQPAFYGLAYLLAIWTWWRFLSVIFINYILTRELIIVRKGIIARSYNSLELFRVKDYNVEQSFFMRLFGIMSVRLYTTDLTTDTLDIKGVPLSNITAQIRDLVQEARIKNRIFEIN
ncbi:PH domain-containing protein [Sunxiuqinia elliptica]|uniref:PH (Pleckstrin Homology) domain-containing protein n=1 Tax=Sunxiuqinia elliptica TaxID=655355 RepID=A0A4R6H0B7_9BACT|nr:PH domain-containing protein [Sunxiuqinia elliptica]TDO01390.1 PH (Pleckstrin Homology) domain-containing protein [Sunxiuqinia elliptica]TDO57901.1 PH (Pleckstrin Homology) domain-containing protein [Sunxiuqinia elliptica]